jgi:hypothetical protein
MNIFDGVIVLMSVIELAVVPPEFLASKSQRGPLTVLRVFRLFRMFKFARNWASLRVLLETIARTLRDVTNFAVVLLLFMYIFALTGMQFFSHKLCCDQYETPLCVQDMRCVQLEVHLILQLPVPRGSAAPVS